MSDAPHNPCDICKERPVYALGMCGGCIISDAEEYDRRFHAFADECKADADLQVWKDNRGEYASDISAAEPTP